jgi:nucleoside-diphosphate-sugar epimerase
LTRAARLRRVIVFGGSGRIGRYLVRELAPSFDVVNADLLPADGGGAFCEVDVLDLNRVRAAVRGADALCHLAGLDLDANADSAEYLRVNALGTWNVLSAAAEAGVQRALLMSSVAACGLSEMRNDWTPQALPVDETHESRPLHGYSVSKLLVENVGSSFALGAGITVLSFRAVAVVTPETLSEYVASVQNPARRWLFYYVTVNDVVRAFRLALERELPRTAVVYLSAADTSRPEPTLEWYRQRVGALPAAIDKELFLRMPRAAVFSTRRARALLSWEPTSDYLDLVAGMAEPPGADSRVGGFANGHPGASSK